MAKEFLRFQDEDGSTVKSWVPWRTGSATIDVTEDASNSDTQNGYGLDLIRFQIPSTFTGTAITLQVCSTSGGTPADLYNDAEVQVSFDVTSSNKGKWVALDTYAAACRKMLYFRFVSNGTEAADRTINYVLG